MPCVLEITWSRDIFPSKDPANSFFLTVWQSGNFFFLLSCQICVFNSIKWRLNLRTPFQKAISWQWHVVTAKGALTWHFCFSWFNNSWVNFVLWPWDQIHILRNKISSQKSLGRFRPNGDLSVWKYGLCICKPSLTALS